MKSTVLFIVATLVSCQILETDISGDTVNVDWPANHARVPAGYTDFRWRTVEGATGYEFAIAAPTFSAGGVVADTTIYADTLGCHQYGCRILLEAGEYEWTVRAFNSGYTTSKNTYHLSVLSLEDSFVHGFSVDKSSLKAAFPD